MEEDKTIAIISPNDVNALTHILSFYERWMLRTLAPSVKRSKHVSEVQFLLIKVSLLGTTKVVILTQEEIAHINGAMRTFITQARTNIPPSQSCDAVIESCEELLQHFLTAFAPGQENKQI